MEQRPAHTAAVPARRSRSSASALARAWPAIPATIVLVVIIVLLGLDNGGYFPSTFIAAGAAAFIALAILLVSAPPQRRVPAVALLGLGLLAAFAAWSGLSGAWSTAADTPVLDMERAMLYVALFGLSLVAADSADHARMLVWSVLAGIVVIVGVGVLSRLQPDVVVGTTDAFTAISYRLSYPLEYWNAFGALASMGGVLALGLAADRRAAAPLRAVFAGSAVLLLVAMYLSLSRGAWLALAVGLLVLIALAPDRGSLLVSAALVGSAVAVAVLRLRAYPALVQNPDAGTGQLVQGNAFTFELVLLVGAAAVLQGVAASKRVMPGFKHRARELRSQALIASAALVVVVALAGIATGAVRPQAAADWADRQWQDFLQTTATGTKISGTERLLSVQGSRSASYRVALDGFGAQPLRGEGAGSFEPRWTRTRELDLKLRDVHSLALETLAELGIVGMALLLGFFTVVGIGARRCLRGRGALPSAPAAAVVATLLVWLAHANVDWDWQMPALTGTAFILAGTLIERGRRRRTRRRQRRHREPPPVPAQA